MALVSKTIPGFYNGISQQAVRASIASIAQSAPVVGDREKAK